MSDLRAARVYDWDDETATLLTQCSLYGLRAGRINVIVDDPQTGAYTPVGEEHLVQTALEAIRILAFWDQDKSKTVPSMHCRFIPNRRKLHMEIIRKNVHDRFGGQASPGDVAPYVLVPGNKQRVEQFAAQWEKSRLIADHYEFILYSGEYAGFPISACSTGIGGTSVAIAIEQLAELGAQTFLTRRCH